MELRLALRRQGYRAAHRLLRAYWFLARPRQHGVKCVLSAGGRVLLVRHTYGRREWDLPGGAIRRDESPLHAARRELREELGVAPARLRALGELEATPYHARDTLHCFHAELDSRELTVDPVEIAAADWFSPERLPSDIGRHTRAILALAGLSGPLGVG